MGVLERLILGDEQGGRMSRHIIGDERTGGSSGRDNRMFVAAVVCIVWTGSPWRDLPDVFGPWNSTFSRLSRWTAKGIWHRIFAAMADDGDFECRALQVGGEIDYRASFAGHIKALLAQEAYRITGVQDGRRFERNVRAILRKIAKITKANDGFGNTSRYQR